MFHGNFQLKKNQERGFQTQTGFSIKQLVGELLYQKQEIKLGLKQPS